MKTKILLTSICLLLLITITLSCSKRHNELTYDVQSIPNKHSIEMTRIPQNDDYSCATTSVAMIITYYKKLSQPLDKDVIWELSETDKNRIYKYGNDISGLNRICDYFQYKYTFKQNMTFDDLRYYISKNMPVVIFIHFKNRRTHATVLNGYDKDKKIFYVIDPSTEAKEMPESFLENSWSAWLSNPKTESYRAGYLVFNIENELK